MNKDIQSKRIEKNKDTRIQALIYDVQQIHTTAV